MARRKKKKLAGIIILPNVLETPLNMAGLWNVKFFPENQPITLEIGCGRGEYTTALAKKYPERNFIGIDAKGDRLWTGASTAYEKGLKNAGFLRIRVENIEQYFARNEIAEIWLTFPDPFPKPSKENLRLMSPGYLNAYKNILLPGGTLHFKTDNTALFDFALETFNGEKVTLAYSTHDLYGDNNNSELPAEAREIQTKYEEKFNNKTKIKYARINF